MNDLDIPPVPHTLLRPVDNLAPGEHACLVYDSDERREEALLRFLEDGLDRGERLVYLARDGDDPVAHELRNRAATNQVAVLPAEDCYLFDGAFDAARALEGFEEALNETALLGFPALRTAGGRRRRSRRTAHRISCRPTSGAPPPSSPTDASSRSAPTTRAASRRPRCWGSSTPTPSSSTPSAATSEPRCAMRTASWR